MDFALAISRSIQDFIDQGGPVLWVIFAACLLLWLLILERAWFVRITWPRRAKQLVAGGMGGKTATPGAPRKYARPRFRRSTWICMHCCR